MVSGASGVLRGLKFLALRIRSKVMKLPVILRPGEDGWIVAECPVIPGCISQGQTRQEALDNIREAIELCLETREEEASWTLPQRYEVVDVEFAA